MLADDTSSTKLVYLAGPIDLVDQESAQNWREQAAEQLRSHGFGVFSPAHAFELPVSDGPDLVHKEMALSVLSINNAAMELCDSVIANLEGPGYGTPIEFHAMLAARKPAVCFNGKTSSLYVKVWPHYSNLDAAVAALVEKYADRD